jgi:hypothetical protein
MHKNISATASLAVLIISWVGCASGSPEDPVGEEIAAVSSSLVLVANMVAENEIDLSWSPPPLASRITVSVGTNSTTIELVGASSYVFAPSTFINPGDSTSLSFQVSVPLGIATSNLVTVSLLPAAPSGVRLSTFGAWDYVSWQNNSSNQSQITIETILEGSIDTNLIFAVAPTSYFSTQSPSGSLCRFYEVSESNKWGASATVSSNSVSCGGGGGKTPKQTY